MEMPDNKDKIGVAIVDDQHLFRQSLAAMIQTVDEFDFVGDAVNGKDFLDKLPDLAGKIKVALVDLDMPLMNGVELNRYLHKHHPAIRVIILSVHDEPRILAQMIEEGASSYLAKNCDKDELITAIQTVSKSGYYITPSLFKALQGGHKETAVPQDQYQLTPRELDVLQLICMEYTNAQIAKKLFISPRTVEGHRNNLLEKTGVQSTAGLALFAVKHKLFEI